MPTRLLDATHKHFEAEVSEIEKCIQNTLEGAGFECEQDEEYNRYLLLLLNQRERARDKVSGYDKYQY